MWIVLEIWVQMLDFVLDVNDTSVLQFVSSGYIDSFLISNTQPNMKIISEWNMGY